MSEPKSLNEIFKDEDQQVAPPAAPPAITTPADPPPGQEPTTEEPPAGTTPPEGEPPVTEDDPTPEEPLTPEEVQAQLEFFEMVNKVRGTDIKVDYGDVSPSSVEGIAMRERAVEQAALERYVAEQAAADPRVEAYRLHRQAGGTDDEFFAHKSFALPDYAVFKEDISLQKKVYTQSLLDSGIDAEMADELVKLAETKGILEAKADAAYKLREDADKKELARLALKMETEAKDYQRKVAEVHTLLDTATSGAELGFIIPDTDKKNFDQFVKGLLHVNEGGEFFIAQPVSKDNVKTLMASLFLAYKKGDLSQVIQRKAQSAVVQRNRLTLQTTKKVASQEPAPGKSKEVPFGQL